MPKLTEAGQREALKSLGQRIRQWGRWSSSEYILNNSSLDTIETQVSNNEPLSQEEYDYLADIFSKELTYQTIVEYTVNNQRDTIYFQDIQGLSADKTINITSEDLENLRDYIGSRLHSRGISTEEQNDNNLNQINNFLNRDGGLNLQQLRFCLDLPVDKPFIYTRNFSSSTCRRFLKRERDLGQTTLYRLCNLLNIDINNEQLVVVNYNQSPNYRRLENFLRNQEFQNADQETYNIMIQAVGKELSESFEADDIKNFPCNILVEINSLWEQYSDEKFCFKKQTEIWLNCGGQIGNLDDRDCLYRFWEQVEWGPKRPKIYDLQNAPSGHLPAMVLQRFCELDFLSRFATCKRNIESQYSRLETFLKNQEFEKADQETYKIMIQAVEKKPRQPGEPWNQEDIKTFRFDVLLEINSLWEQYSDEKFGFRKQTEIWRNCGGQIGTFDDRVCLDWFWDKVKWGLGRPRIYDLQEAPIGHFPATISQRIGELELFSRFATCELTEKYKKYEGGKYSLLEILLRKQQFEDADSETYNLMIQAVDGTPGESFNEENINNFPDHTLLTINLLWEQYSNHKFGFRKQTQIWRDCGGKIGIVDDKNCLYKFWSRLGWYTGQPMIYDVENAPLGHLPRQVLREFCELSFMSRFAICERNEENIINF